MCVSIYVCTLHQMARNNCNNNNIKEGSQHAIKKTWSIKHVDLSQEMKPSNGQYMFNIHFVQSAV